MDLATGAMGSLLVKLGQLLTEEYKLQTGVKEDVEYLERELKSMHAALRKVGDVPRDQLDEQVKLWANEVRDLSFIMEDNVDKFLLRVEGVEPAIKPRKLKKLMKKMGNLFSKSKTRHEISGEIRGIKVRIKEAADRRDSHRVDDVVANPTGAVTIDPRLLALYKDQKELVGINDSLNEITKMMSDGDGDAAKQLKILSIFGFGGLGKTTLAKTAYDKNKAQFDFSAFVPVGRKPSGKKVLNDILLEIDGQKYSELDERQLINKLRGLLENKRYLIVIDDIWEINTWELIKTALLQPLSLDLSKDLFHTRLSRGAIEWPNHLPAEVYNKILHKCGGVPLAIITIASLLVGKPVELWSNVYTSIGFGHEENEDVENTRKILLFSYYDLPCHLKTCLLYLSIYPEDHLIEKDSLIWKLVAEGFIHGEPGVGLFEIGERYFNELVNKSMIMPVEATLLGMKFHHGIITGCRVHDIMLDMIRVLSREEKFVTVLDSDEQYTTSHCNAHRLAVHNGVQPLASTSTLQARSVNAMCSPEMLPSLSCFEVLRVLALDGPTSSHYPNCLEHVGKLVHLRHLKLGSIGISELPKEIGHLKFLLVLDLAENSISELPESIGQLSQLKCSNICVTDIKVPSWIGNLTSLEELCLGEVGEDSNFVTELGKWTELRKLRISKAIWVHGDGKMNSWAESLAKVSKIHVIDIYYVFGWREPSHVDNRWEWCALPPQLCVLRMVYDEPGLVARINPRVVPNLSHLKLYVYTPELELFGSFRELVSLELVTRSALHHDTMGGACAFPKLRVFKTQATFDSFQEGDMPVLENLWFMVIAQSNDDDDISFGFDFGSLGNLPLLQSVTIFLYAPPVDHSKAEETVKRALDVLPNRRRHDMILLKKLWGIYRTTVHFHYLEFREESNDIDGKLVTESAGEMAF
ncbi:disease resistance protein RGA5-like [Triticum dicoccoides]|uniref:disease resistance protein RGA5-like n=1 Tax=Triticum dicoccoides TaxID=85692 RepID=UPI001890A882|nr:disease resistance protein RGA5-like [Triticum dicoccoides]